MAFKPPSAGECFTLTKKQTEADVWSAGAIGVECAEPHNAQITGTPSIPTKYAEEGYRSAVVRAWSIRACDDARRNVESRPTLAFDYATWLPSKQAWNEGSRTVICAGLSYESVGKKHKLATTIGAYNSSKFVRFCRVFKAKKSAWVNASCSASGAKTLWKYEPLPWAITAAFPGKTAIFAKVRSLAGRDGWSVTDPTKKAWNRGSRFYYLYR